MENEQKQPLGACVIVLNADKTQVLLGKRKNSYKAGWYGLPGGRLEVGEPVLACATRELQEETGLVTNQLEYLGVVRDWQETYDFIHFVFLYAEPSGEAVCSEPDKCEGWEWFPLDQLPSPVLDGHLGAIQLFLNRHQLVTPQLLDLHQTTSEPS